MSYVHQIIRKAGTAVSSSPRPDGLKAINQPDCAAAIWYPRPLPQFQDWIDRLLPDQLPRTRTIMRPETVVAALDRVADLCDTPRCAERTMLIDDIAAMAHVFASIVAATHIRLRLDVVNTDACRKFHIDAVTARLVCTYRGTGTQYGTSPDGAEPARVETVPTGAPMILRGTLWPERPQSGLLHRSPPIAGTGETRLVLVLDPVLGSEQQQSHEFLH